MKKLPEELKQVRAVFLFPNNNIAVTDQNGEQIVELQGIDTPELRAKIDARITPYTERHNY